MFKLFGTNKIPKDKAATFGYKSFESEKLKDVVEYINTHAIVPCFIEDGHRLRNNVKEIYNWIRLDVDVEGESKKIDKALKKVFHIKKPSTSHKKYPYKWHYLIPIENVSQNYDGYKLQYYKFLAEFGIEIKDKSLASVVQNTNPMGEDGIALTYVNKGKPIWIAPDVVVPKRKKLKEKHSDVSKDEVKKLLTKVDPDCTYSEWLQVGFSLFDWCPKRGLKLFDKWSKGSDKYDGTTIDKWNDFENNAQGDITIGTLIHMVHGEKKDPTEAFKVEKGRVHNKGEKKKASCILSIFGDTYMTDEDYKKIEDQKYLIEGFVPEQGFGMLVGRESSGKSWVTFYLSNLILDKYPEQQVLFFDIDSGAVYTKPRVQHLRGKYGDRFLYYSQHKGVTSYDLKEQLKEACEHDLTNKLFVIDSLFGLTDGKVNDAKDIKPVLNIMEGLRNAGATVILIHHDKKDGGYNGSAAIGGALDFMYGVVMDEKIVTLDLKKDRGVFTSHTVKVSDYNRCEGEEIAYISGDKIKEKDAQKEKAETQREKDQEIIDQIITVIRDIEHRGLNTNKTMIYKNMNNEFGVNQRTVAKIIVRYTDELWEEKIKKDKLTKKNMQLIRLL